MVEGFKPFSNIYFLLILNIFLQSFSLLSIKLSTLSNGFTVYLLLGFAFIFLLTRAFIWQMLLKFSDLSNIYPFSAFVQVLILIYSIFIFDEVITLYNIIGLLIMLYGVTFLNKKSIQ